MAFGFKKPSGSSTSGSKASANPQPVAAQAAKPAAVQSAAVKPAANKPTTIDVHPEESMKKSSVFPSAAVAVAISLGQTRVRAFEIYLARGDKPGDAITDWNQAERELRSAAMGVASKNL